MRLPVLLNPKDVIRDGDEYYNDIHSTWMVGFVGHVVGCRIVRRYVDVAAPGERLYRVVRNVSADGSIDMGETYEPVHFQLVTKSS